MAYREACFLGVPLDPVQPDFADLIEAVGETSPDLVIVRPEIPHVTTHYLGKLSPDQIEELMENIASVGELLAGTRLTIDGSGTNQGDSETGIVYLGVNDGSQRLKEFRRGLNGFLTEPQRAKTNKRPFVPHVTIGYIRAPLTVASVYKESPDLQGLLGLVHWGIPITELVLYGKRPNGECRGIERLETIPI